MVNVARLVSTVRVPHQEQRHWSAAEAATFLAATADHRYAHAFRLGLYGLRRGEVLGLRWPDVDFDAATVTIRATRVVAGREVLVSEPKSERSRRVVPIDPDTVAILRHVKAHQGEQRLAAGAGFNPDGYVVVTQTGRPLRPEYYSEVFTRAAAEAGLPPIRLHDCRHTAATALLDLGTAVHTTAALLGHDPAVTLRTYAHADAQAMRAAGSALAAALGSAG